MVKLLGQYKRVPGSSVEKLYISSSLYQRDRRSEAPSHSRIEVTYGYSFMSTGVV